MPPSMMAMGATPAMTVSGAAAETTKKEMSAVVRVPVRSPGAAGCGVGGGCGGTDMRRQSPSDGMTA